MENSKSTTPKPKVSSTWERFYRLFFFVPISDLYHSLYICKQSCTLTSFSCWRETDRVRSLPMSQDRAEREAVRADVEHKAAALAPQTLSSPLSAACPAL